MEKTYEAVIAQVKQAYLNACWGIGLADERDYNGSEYYQIETVSYAEGRESSLIDLIKKLGIVVSEEEIEKAKQKGREQAWEDA